MTWQRFWSLLLTQWRLLVIALLVGGTGAFLLGKMSGSLYVSSALVQVTVPASSGSPDASVLQMSTQLALTDAQLANSYPILQQVAPHYDDLTEATLEQEVTASARPGTPLFAITVQDNSPERAASLANDIAAAVIQQQIAALNQSNASAQTQIQQELTRTHNQINDTVAQVNALQGENQAKSAILQAQLEVQEQHYSQWQTMLAQLNLSQAQSNTFLRVVQPAEANYTAVRPDILRDVEIGLLIGLLGGVLFLVLYELFDVRLHTAEAARRFLAWPLLGTVWLANPEANEQVFNPQAHEMNTEAYRILRTNLGFAHLEHALLTLMVTSASSGEGKSTVAANLAVSLARAGRNTLLIDADLRRPTLHTLFQIAPDKPGLSNALASMGGESSARATGQFAAVGQGISASTGALAAAGQHTLELFFHYVGLPNLRVMPAGTLPANPSELLDSRVMPHLIKLLKTSGADMVIFDTPPAFGLADVGILSSKVDGTLVVVDPGLPTRNQLKSVKALLSRTGVHVVGCVLNKQIPARDDISAFQYYSPASSQQGIGAVLSHLLLKKESPSIAGTPPANLEKGLVHTAYHGRNP